MTREEKNEQEKDRDIIQKREIENTAERVDPITCKQDSPFNLVSCFKCEMAEISV